MKQFKNGQRVVVTDKSHELHGVQGVVVRLRMSDDAAWVRMDERPIKAAQLFPFGNDDNDSRQNHAMLWPNGCSPVNEPTRKAPRAVRPSRNG